MAQFDREELAWAAGFFDGEGHIGVRRNGPSFPSRRIGLHVGQADRRPLDRFLRAVGVGQIRGPDRQSKYPNAKLMFRFHVDNFQHAQHVVAVLWRWLSEPKREQAHLALTAYAADPHRRRGVR
jgi:hypothetical protein